MSHRVKGWQIAAQVHAWLPFLSGDLRVTELSLPCTTWPGPKNKWKCRGNKDLASSWRENNTERATGHIPDSLEPWKWLKKLFPCLLPSFSQLESIPFLILAASGWSVTIGSAAYSQPRLLFLPVCLGRKPIGQSLLISPSPVASHLILYIDLEMKAAIIRNTISERGKTVDLTFIA